MKEFPQPGPDRQELPGASPREGAGKPDLILGTVQNYTFEQLRPFVLSLKNAGYRGEVAFFCHNVDANTSDRLRGMGVQIVPFRNFRSVRAARRKREFMDWLSRQYYRYKWPRFDVAWTFLLATSKQRYELAHRFLCQHGHRYRRVLLVDTRDVFFQRDPFAGDMPAELNFFAEDHRQLLRTGRYNPVWILTLLGRDVLERIGDKTTLCAGTTMGTPRALRFYLEQFLRIMKGAFRLDGRYGDQAIHNALVYEGLGDCPFPTAIHTNAAGAVYTLGHTLPTEEIRLSVAGEVLSPKGQPVPILHQYDRHPSVASVLLARLGSGDGAGSPERAFAAPV